MPVKLSPEEVDRIALDAAGFLDAVSPSTRSAGRTVAKISPIFGDVSDAATRADDGTDEDSAEELFYAVDFAEGEGYALISADRRLPDEVLVNVGSGSFPEGEIENPGFALMMEGAENYARREIARYEARHDSIEIAMLTRLAEEDPELAESIEEYLASIGDGGSRPETRVKAPIIYELVLVDTRYEYGPWTTTQQITPMIPVEWGQRGAFNDTVVDNTKWEDTPAGCVAIALVQLMAYWQHPTSYHGISVDWGELCRWTGAYSDLIGGYKIWNGGRMTWAPQSTQDMCADLIWRIGLDVDMNYGEEGSGAQNTNAINLLQSLGYNAPSRQNYKITSVLNSLGNGRPVYIKGGSQQILGIFPGINGNHAWLIDGYLKQQQEVTVTRIYEPPASIDPTQLVDLSHYTTTSTETRTRTREFFHNNFGWEGRDNGYYVCGIFDSNNGVDLPSNTRAEKGNYKYNLRVWTNIYH